LLIFPLLIFGGICDLFPIINDYNFDLFSPQTKRNIEWVKTNTKPTDNFLSFNGGLDFILAAGRKEFVGGQYYAWSLGYPVEKRVIEIKAFRDKDYPKEPFCKYLETNKIKFISYSTKETTYLSSEGFDNTKYPELWGKGVQLEEDTMIYSTDNICQIR
jgi:hypothetical protein